MSGGSSANNSWTILTPPEEAAAETLRPLAEGTEHHDESHTSAADPGEIQPARGAESAEALPVEGYLVSEEKTAELSGGTSTEQEASVPPTLTGAPVPTSLEVAGRCAPGDDALSRSEGLPEGPAHFSPDPDSFSESYTHVTPSPDETPSSLLSTETLGGAECVQEEEERLAQEGTPHPINGEELRQEGDETDLSQRTCDVGKQADSPVDSEDQKTGEEGEPEVRRRRSLLAALERIGRTEEEEEVDEVFHLPQRGEDSSGFSVNKCILGAVILLGLGTIFFSGVFMDLDEESDYGTRELKDAELPVKQEWLNPEVPPAPLDPVSAELLNKLAKGSQQISVLQAQLQAQKEELKVAKGQAAEGAKERLRWGEVEKENSRLKEAMASVPVLQKENERMKRELQSVPALQKELETLRSTVTELKLSSAAGEAAPAPVQAATLPSSGQQEDSTPDTDASTVKQPRKPWDNQQEKNNDPKKEKRGMGEKERKEREKSERMEGEKRESQYGGKAEMKKGKREQEKFDKVKNEEGKQKRPSDETKEWKKEKASRGDEGKPWKDREGKKERVEKSERKEGKEERDWKKARHEKVNDGKQWRGKDEKKDWKEHGEKRKGKEEWKKGNDGKERWEKKDWKEKGEKKELKKGNDGKEKWEKKDWKEKGEKKEWKKDKNDKGHGKEGKWKGEGKEDKNRDKERKGKDENEWKSKNGKRDNKEWKRTDERKQRNEDDGKGRNDQRDREWKGKDERKQRKKKEEQWKRGEQKDWTRDKEERRSSGGREEEHLWGNGKPAHTHRQPAVDQPEYWAHQRGRLQHNPKPAQHCGTPETCAQAEGLLPVPFPEFDAILQKYLAKADEAGVDDSARDELKKLAAEFFQDGVFVHDQMSFRDFVEDVGDVLEDMVEGGEEEEEEDSALEDEMEGFEREVMETFSAPGAGEKADKPKGERRRESERGRG